MQEEWRPQRGCLVAIEPVDAVNGAECLTGIVVEAPPGTASGSRVMVDVGETPLLASPKAEVTVSFFSSDALHRAQAMAIITEEQPHIVELDVRQLEHIERRDGPRRRLALSCALGAFDGPGDFSTVKGRVVDLGTGGCRVRTTTAFPSGTDPTVVIKMPDGPPVVALGQILESNHVRSHYEYRLMFQTIAEPDVGRLADVAAR